MFRRPTQKNSLRGLRALAIACCVLVGAVQAAPSDVAFVYNVRASTPNAGLAQHALNNMPGVTNIGNPGLRVFGMDFNVSNDTLYILDSTAAEPAPPILRILDQTTGTPTTIATVTGLGGALPTDLVINPQNGAAFVSTGDTLFSFNLTTAVATPIGTMAAGQLMIDLAINCQGQMYGHSISDDALYSVNSTTGAATFIGAHGLAANFAQGMDFDNQDGQLYAWVYTGGGTYTFGTFNLTTGAITPVNTNTPPGEWEGAIRNTCARPPADANPRKAGGFMANGAANCRAVNPADDELLVASADGLSNSTAGPIMVVCSQHTDEFSRYSGNGTPLQAGMSSFTLVARNLGASAQKIMCTGYAGRAGSTQFSMNKSVTIQPGSRQSLFWNAASENANIPFQRPTNIVCALPANMQINENSNRYFREVGDFVAPPPPTPTQDRE